MTYGEKLRSLRLAAGLTQKQLGMACGYDDKNADRNVRSWEADEMMPRLSMVRALAAALKVPLDTLIP